MRNCTASSLYELAQSAQDAQGRLVVVVEIEAGAPVGVGSQQGTGRQWHAELDTDGGADHSDALDLLLDGRSPNAGHRAGEASRDSPRAVLVALEDRRPPAP